MFERNFLKTINIFGFIFLMLSCSNTSKVPKADTFPFEIHFGSTGGFTNLNPVFIIKSNGEVFKKDNAKANPLLLKNIDATKIDSIYLLIKQSNFADLKISNISNYTNYIEINYEKCNNKIMWYNQSQIPTEVQNLYKFLLSIIKK